MGTSMRPKECMRLFLVMVVMREGNVPSRYIRPSLIYRDRYSDVGWANSMIGRSIDHEPSSRPTCLPQLYLSCDAPWTYLNTFVLETRSKDKSIIIRVSGPYSILF